MILGPYDLPGAYTGDAVDMMREIPDGSIHCCITSPPYWGLRSYLDPDDPDKAREIGAEATPDQYVASMVRVFREVQRVLRNDGVCWLNLGDCYSNKNLTLIPYRVALALQDDGWLLRSNIVWAKGLSFCEHYSGSVMPESIRDRPTSAHEAVFLLTKSDRYYYDQDAVRETLLHPDAVVPSGFGGNKSNGGATYSGNEYKASEQGRGRNLRNVWAISPGHYAGSHYAVFPPQLVAPMVEAGCPVGGIVLDPFMGSGTTGQAAEDRGRLWIGFDLDERNATLIRKRTAQTSLLRLAAKGQA